MGSDKEDKERLRDLLEDATVDSNDEDEAFWGLKAHDTITMGWHLEAIKELIMEFESGYEANGIPLEVRVT